MAYGFRRYVPMAERWRRAEAEVAGMRRRGVAVQPVRIEGRLIARTFWGKAWCDHLESFSDFENRLPRGRTYVRNGSVRHLEILPGVIRARVQGSEMYTVSVGIDPLDARQWTAIRKRCTGKISSLLDLLQGRLSAGVMEVVTDRRAGLFPQPTQIEMQCSCPDWAVMCKHVAAVLYGVGARLDEKPELLFLLRGVDHEELIEAHAEAAVQVTVKKGKGRRIADSDLAEVFGIEIEDAAASSKTRRPSPKRKQVGADAPFPRSLTGKDVRLLRERMDLNQGEFARTLDVSPAVVSVWERSTSPLRLQQRTRAALEKAWRSMLP
ncbi:MAG TPA: SWIM zinc finger family protein [Spirochaetia bacterium]|nr:SWIM zinc finger family protein [Spirochaetia bacterium]